MALNAIGDAWDKSIKSIFHKIILESEEDENIKQMIVKRMRQRPTQESMKILARGLDQTENYDLQIEIIKVLKIMNPKGPEFNLKETEKADEIINYWQKWANDLK